MSVPAPDTSTTMDSKVIEFTAFDRKVSVLQSEDQQTSLYSLVRSWVLNGRPGPVEAPEDASAPPVVLPPSQPLAKETLKYPPECFSKFYLDENSSSGEIKNLANVYKSAWVTAHTHYSRHKLKRRKRHAQRHTALLSVAERAQKARQTSSNSPPNVKLPAAPQQPAVPATPGSPTVQPASIAPVAAPSSQALSAAPTTSQQPLIDPSSRRGAISRQPSSQPNTAQPLACRGGSSTQTTLQRKPPSPSTFGTTFGSKDLSGVENPRTAHNLADRSGSMNTGTPHGGGMHDIPASAPHSHSMSGSVGLGDMHLQASHPSHQANQQRQPQQQQQQQIVSRATSRGGPAVGIDGPSMRPPQTSTGKSMNATAHAYSMSMNAQRGGVTVGVGGVAGVGGVQPYGGRMSSQDVTWEGHHSDRDTEDLQRQLQQLAEKESPVPTAIQPPMPDHHVQHMPHALSRRLQAAGRSNDAMCTAAGDAGGAGQAGPGAAAGGQIPRVPGGDPEHPVELDQAQRTQALGAMRGVNGRQVGGQVAAGRDGQSVVPPCVGPADIMLDCKPSRSGSALLDMKDAFALDEVMDISPVQ